MCDDTFSPTSLLFSRLFLLYHLLLTANLRFVPRELEIRFRSTGLNTYSEGYQNENESSAWKPNKTRANPTHLKSTLFDNQGSRHDDGRDNCNKRTKE